MKINLKQAEIIEALKHFVSSQGIRLVGKDVEITFTAGRKETGISAEITIEESDLPAFISHEDEKEDHAPVTLTVVTPIHNHHVEEPANKEQEIVEEVVKIVEQEPEVVPKTEEVLEPVVQVKPPFSIFG